MSREVTIRRPAGDTDYDTDPQPYHHHRRPDPRIEAIVWRALGDVAWVANVGAGTGSYEPHDRYVVAVEPARSMRGRRRDRGLPPAIDAAAGSLPFDDDAFDAAMAVMTVHQWPDVRAGLRELRRVARGPVVVMTLDPDRVDGFWLGDYLPERFTAQRERFPSLDVLRDALGGDVTVEPVPVPHDCTDGFLEAWYARPEAMLDPSVRSAQSGWQQLPAHVTASAMTRLSADLASGAWDQRHGAYRSQNDYIGPLCLLTSRPAQVVTARAIEAQPTTDCHKRAGRVDPARRVQRAQPLDWIQ